MALRNPMEPERSKPPVLVVDDNAMNRAAFTAVLADDYAVTTASSGEQALKLAAHDDFAVILLDVRMPGLDGFETAERLRQMERTRWTPIVFLSAYDQTTVPAKCGYIAGATDFLFGMVDEEHLKVKVATFVLLHQRDAAVKTHLRELNAQIETLRAEAARQGPGADRLARRIRELEHVADALRHQLMMQIGLGRRYVPGAAAPRPMTLQRPPLPPTG